MPMKLFIALLVCGSIVAAGAAAQSVKIGVVNLVRIEKESASARRANDALLAEFEPRNRQIEEFQKRIAAAHNRLKTEGDKMPPSERDALVRDVSGMMRQSDQMLRALTEELDLRRRELGVRIVEEARAAIKTVAEAGKFDLILQEAAFARPSVDITDDVLKEMAKRSAAR